MIENTEAAGNGPDWGDAANASAAVDERRVLLQGEERRRWTQAMPVPLTVEQKAEMMDDVARLCAEREDAEAKKKAASEMWGGRVKTLDAQIDELAGQAREGTVPRQIECIEVWDDQSGSALYYRLDTSACFDRRALTAEERQGKLALVDDDDDDLRDDETEDPFKADDGEE